MPSSACCCDTLALHSFPTRRSSDLAGDADDSPRLRGDADELHDRIGPHQLPVDGVLIGEQALREALTHDHDLFGASTIGLREVASGRSEEHTSELQSLRHLVCRLLLAAATP